MEIYSLFKSIITTDGGAFGIVLAVCLGVAYLHRRFILLAEKIEQTATRTKETEVRAETVFDRIDKRIESMRDDLHRNGGDIQYIKSMMNSLVSASQSSAPALVQSHSPLALTDMGRKAADEMSAVSAVAANWERIRTILDAEMPSRNPYDIQTFCLERIPTEPERFFDPSSLDAFKVYAFNHGRTLFDCLKVAGVLVRDKCFEERGIPLASLDAASRKMV